MLEILSVDLIPGGGNLKASVQIETPHGNVITGNIVKQPKCRAYIELPPGLNITHKQKRLLQREAVKRWASMISDTLEGLLESETVFTGDRFSRLGVQLKVHCHVCDRNTPSEFSKTEKGLNRNVCYLCGTFRKNKPYIGQREMEEITDKLSLIQKIQGHAMSEVIEGEAQPREETL